MRIAHCCLSCFYIDGYGYQENILPRMNKKDGHEVKILASTETFSSEGLIEYTQPGTYINDDGIEVTRIPYRRLPIPTRIKAKLRYYDGVYHFLETYRPDVILFHGDCGHGIVEVASYVSDHQSVRLFMDSHATFANSASNLLSKVFLHRLFGRYCLKRAQPFIRAVLCITPDSAAFVNSLYGVPHSLIEFFPLGGTIISDDSYRARREETRSSIGIDSNSIVCLHSGKLSKDKRTKTLIDAWKMIQIGDKAPEVLGRDENGNEIRLSRDF